MPHWNCPETVEEPAFNPHAGGVDVTAISCDGRSFDANIEVDPPARAEGFELPPAHFTATWTRTVGIARVAYGIQADGGANTALFSNDLSEGTVKPPAPFFGEATIRRQGEDWEWSGSLGAHFLGHAVPLTGPDFEPIVTTFNPSPGSLEFIAVSKRC